MLRLIYGGFGSGKSTKVMAMISELLKKKDPYKKSVYLIVPEQDTVRAELDATKKLAPSSALCFEVQNFSRLANAVFRSLGGLCYNYADSTAKCICMWKTLRAVSGLLLGAKENPDESSVNRYLSVISELRASGIDKEKLEGAAKALGADSELGREIHDLSIICSVYESELESLYQDNEKDLDKLCDLLEHHRFFAGCDIFIDGFTSFTAPQLRLIKKLLRDADSVSVTLPLDLDRGEYLSGREIVLTKNKLVDIADSVGESVELLSVGSSVRSEKKDIRYVADNAYLSGAPSFDGAVENVEIYRCADLTEEADAVATFIRKKILLGARYRDIAIIARDPRAYAGVLDHALEAHGISCFFSSELRPDSHPAVKLLYSAISIYSKGAAREDVISFLKTGLCNVDQNDVDLFEKYASAWKLDGRRLLDEKAFVNSPAGFTDKHNQKLDYVLLRVNEVKKSLVSTLFDFFSRIAGERSVGEMCRAVWSLLESLCVKEKLELEASQYEKQGNEQAARESEGIFSSLVSTLDTMMLVAGEEHVSSAEFLILLKMSVRTKRVSVIPTSADAVTVGNAQLLRVSSVKHAFIIGASEGSFPLPVRDNGYFDAAKRKRLSEIGIDIEYDVEENASKELYYFSRAAALPTESLCITYAASSSSRASSCVFAIKRLLGMKGEDRLFSELPVYERVYDRASLEEALLTADVKGTRDTAGASALAMLGRSTSPEGYSLQSKLSCDSAKMLFSKKLSMTQARLESYARCPFAFFARYVLGIEKNEKYEFGAADIGNFVHFVLDRLTGDLSRNGVFRSDISREELDAGIDAIISDYLDGICPENDSRSARLVGVISRIRHSVALIASDILDEFSSSEFIPIAHEMKIESSSENNPSPLEFTLSEGASLSLYGTLDRADVYKRDGELFVRVVDYKTGAKDFSMKDVEHGLNLQLMIYLFTLCEQTEASVKRALGGDENSVIRPAGMLYYSASVGDVLLNSPSDAEQILKKAKKNLKRRGLLTDRTSILRAMEPELKGDYIPVVDNGDELKASAGSVLLADEDFSGLRSLVETVVVSMTDKLCSGDVEAVPSEYLGKRICDKCEMRVVCRRYDGYSNDNASEEEDDE